MLIGAYRTEVSIPLRKFRKVVRSVFCVALTLVSIPLRKFRKDLGRLRPDALEPGFHPSKEV